MSKTFGLVLISLLLAGCQSLKESQKRYLETLCTYEGAYSQGVEDAENKNGSSAIDSLSACPQETRTEALRGYNEGYASVAHPEKELGGLFGQVLKSTGIIKELYTCEIEVFTKVFSEKGKTKQEALYKTKKSCVTGREGDDFFCRDLTKYKCVKIY